MKCTNCNNELNGTENFCRKCGFPVKKDIEKTDESIDNKIENNPEASDNLGDTSIDLNEVISSNLIKKDEKYKIENTQELLVSNTDSSKKIKSILDELKNSKKEDTDISFNDKSKNANDSVKKQFEESKKKIADLEEQNNTKIKNSDANIDKTILVDPITDADLSNKSKEEKDVINENTEKSKNTETSLIQIEKNDNKSKLIDDSIEQVENEKVNNSDEDDEIVLDETSTQSGTGKFVFVLLLFILTLCFSIYLLINNISLSEKLKKSDDDYNKLSENITKSNNNVSNSNSASKSKILYGCYLISSSENINILDSAISFSYSNLNIELSIGSDISLNNIKLMKDDYKKLLEQKGYIISSYGTKVIEEREYVFFDTLENNVRNLIVYTSGLKNDSLMFKIKNNEQNINFENLKIIGKYINSLKCENSNKLLSSDYFIKK